MLLQEESQRASHTNVNSVYENAAMNVRFTSMNKSSNQKNDDKKVVDTSLIYDYSKLTRYVRDKCFELHGYSEWHRLYRQSPNLKLTIRNCRSVLMLLFLQVLITILVVTIVHPCQMKNINSCW